MQNNPLKILLADDDAEMLSLISSLLSEAGYDVITAEDGIEALEKAKTDILISPSLRHEPHPCCSYRYFFSFSFYFCPLLTWRSQYSGSVDALRA